MTATTLPAIPYYNHSVYAHATAPDIGNGYPTQHFFPKDLDIRQIRLIIKHRTRMRSHDSVKFFPGLRTSGDTKQATTKGKSVEPEVLIPAPERLRGMKKSPCVRDYVSVLQESICVASICSRGLGCSLPRQEREMPSSALSFTQILFLRSHPVGEPCENYQGSANCQIGTLGSLSIILH